MSKFTAVEQTRVGVYFHDTLKEAAGYGMTGSVVGAVLGDHIVTVFNQALSEGNFNAFVSAMRAFGLPYTPTSLPQFREHLQLGGRIFFALKGFSCGFMASLPIIVLRDLASTLFLSADRILLKAIDIVTGTLGYIAESIGSSVYSFGSRMLGLYSDLSEPKEDLSTLEHLNCAC